MMTYALTFLAGVASGSLLTTAIAVVIAKSLRRYNQRPSLAGTLMQEAFNAAEKLVKARKRLGQIANRESIGEARKIANIALKELEK